MKRPLPGSNPTSASNKLVKLDRHGWWNLFMRISYSIPSADPKSVPWMSTLAEVVGGQPTTSDIPSIQDPTDWDGLASIAPARNSTGQSCIHLLWVWSDLTYLGQLAPRHIVGGPRAWSEPHRRRELLGTQHEARICRGGHRGIQTHRGEVWWHQLLRSTSLLALSQLLFHFRFCHKSGFPFPVFKLLVYLQLTVGFIFKISSLFGQRLKNWD